MSRANPAYSYHRQRYLSLQPTSKRSQLLPTSHCPLVLLIILLSSYYQLHTTINFISSILLPTTHLLLITTPYSLLPTIYLPTTFFLSPLSTAAKNFLYSTTYPFTALPTALPTFFPIASLLYYLPPYLLLIITTTYLLLLNFTTPLLFFHF